MLSKTASVVRGDLSNVKHLSFSKRDGRQRQNHRVGCAYCYRGEDAYQQKNPLLRRLTSM